MSRNRSKRNRQSLRARNLTLDVVTVRGLKAGTYYRFRASFGPSPYVVVEEVTPVVAWDRFV